MRSYDPSGTRGRRSLRRLTKKRQNLALEYQGLVVLLAGYFLKHRPEWQRANLRGDLEGEGYLALCKAARTYDPKRLPYPKAYFARAVLNGMYKYITRRCREPSGQKIPLEVIQDSLGVDDELDHLRLAIEMLPERHQDFASDRFEHCMTIRGLASEHDIPLKRSSARARSLAAEIARLLDIQLPSPR